MASGVQQKVAKFVQMGTSGLNLFGLWQQASKNCQICSDAGQGTFEHSQEDLQVQIKQQEIEATAIQL